jgi:hypothetical protein
VAENFSHERLSGDAEACLLYFSYPGRLASSGPTASTLAPHEAAKLFDAAALHGVLPAVLNLVGPLLPRHDDRYALVLEDAHTRLRQYAALSLLLTHHAREVMKAMNAAGLDATVVKGPTFARRIYPQPWLRTFTDVDVLVVPEHRAKAGEVMRTLGFRAVVIADRAGQDYAEDKWCLAGATSVDVEIHTDLVHSPKLRSRLHVGYRDALAAGGGNPEAAGALLLLAAAHGAIGHQFERLQHLIDVALIASGAAGPVDVGRLRAVAERCGVAAAVAAALDLADRVYPDDQIRDLAEVFGHKRLNPLARLLLTRNSVVRTHAPDRAFSGWRRKLFRQLQRMGGDAVSVAGKD